MRKQIRYLGRIAVANRGTPLLRLRQLYLSKVQPLITYGCAVWFLRGSNVRWRLSKTLTKELESLQHQCLVQIAGAFQQIHSHYILKELSIPPLAMHLEVTAIAWRARALEPKSTVFQFRAWRPSLQWVRPASTRATSLAHPYHVLDREARMLRELVYKHLYGDHDPVEGQHGPSRESWNDPKFRAKAIKKYLKKYLDIRASQEWVNWQMPRQADPPKHQPALWDTWGIHNIRLYKVWRREILSPFRCAPAFVINTDSVYWLRV